MKFLTTVRLPDFPVILSSELLSTGGLKALSPMESVAAAAFIERELGSNGQYVTLEFDTDPQADPRIRVVGH